jgi:ABC-type dipeptide/oligopeptide/nickel transport system permease subunit
MIAAILDPRARRRFWKNRGARVGVALVGFLIVFALVGPLFARHDAYVSDFVFGATKVGEPVPPSSLYWLGTDRIFRDVYVRLAYGARLSLVIAISATLISTIIGAGVGLVSGFYEGTKGVRVPYASLVFFGAAFVMTIVGRSHLALALIALGIAFVAIDWVLPRKRAVLDGPTVDADTALMRLVDIGLSFPFLLLVMALAAAFDRTTVATILWTLGLTSWLGTARVVRAKTLSVRNLDFVSAARALGQPVHRILISHVLPNVAGPVIVLSTAQVASMIVAESVLSYLGVGIAPPTPTWGHMLYEGQDVYQSAPWLLVAPAFAILLSVLGFNLVGEGLRDALDPKED